MFDYKQLKEDSDSEEDVISVQKCWEHTKSLKDRVLTIITKI